MSEEKRVIEINGVKLEVDLRNARRIDEFRVGDNVKVLDTRSGKNEVRSGVITDFANFKDLPTIIVAMYKAGDYWMKPTIEFIYFNSDTEGIEIVGVSAEEIIVSKDTIVQMFDDEIIKKRDELQDLIVKRDNLCLNILIAHLHDVASSDENLARVGGKKPGCEMQKRGLAAAARAHQRLEAARFHLQRKVLEDFLLPIFAAHAACVKSIHTSSRYQRLGTTSVFFNTETQRHRGTEL